MRYENPVIPGFHPDPSICRVGEDFYLVTSSFEYFPGVPVFHSRDLVHWRQIGHCLTRRSQLELEGVGASHGIFAPTIRYHDGLFYMTTTNVTRGGNFIVTATDPAGEWSDPVWVDQPGIDPSLFFDDDGKVYYTTSSDGIKQSEIDVRTGAFLAEPRIVWAGTGGAYPEGPHLYKKDGWYYLVISEGGTELGHMITTARSRHPHGPYESFAGNPILSHRSLPSPIKSTGHADIVQDADGRWWTVCLATRPVGYPFKHHLGRETFLVPTTWEEGGWPVVGSNGTLEAVMEAELPGTAHLSEAAGTPAGVAFSREADRPAFDDFDHLAPALCWNFLRNPHAEDWSLGENPGSLTLHGSAATLGDEASPAFLGRRLEHFVVTCETALSFSPASDGEEAGLTVLMNNRFHYEIALKRIAGQVCVVFRRTLGSLSREDVVAPFAGGTVRLSVETDGIWFNFRYADESGVTLPAGRGECGLLSTEVAGGFTGVYVGLYATGNGRRCDAPALFDSFSYAPAQDQTIR